MSLLKLIHCFNLILRYPLFVLKKNRLCVFKVHIGSGSSLRGSTIGNYSYIGKDCTINHTSIGNYTCIADGVQIGGMEHPYWDYSISPRLSNEFIFGKETIIGHDVWIASGCIIKQGVTIGNGAVVGANSFVNKDIPPYAIVFGTPAVIHKYRFDDKTINKVQKSEFWYASPESAKKILDGLKSNSNE